MSTVYSIQAIVLSSEMAHNLGFSDLNCTLLAAAIRLAQYMGLHKITEASSSSGVHGSDQWHEAIEREVGKRVWCQIVIQDHFGLCFTDSYSGWYPGAYHDTLGADHLDINPKHCLTELPKNCDDHDLEERKPNIPTITSYLRILAQSESVPHLAKLEC